MNFWKTPIMLSCIALLAACDNSLAQHSEQSSNQGVTMTRESPSNPQLRKLSGEKIYITVGSKTMLVELYDNSAANDLLTKLPLSFKISDYAGWDEKLIRLDRKNALSMKDYTGGDDPAIPELGYYEPGN